MRKGSVWTVNHNDKEIVLALRTALAERIGRDRFDVWFGSGVRSARGRPHGADLRQRPISAGSRSQPVSRRLGNRLQADLRDLGPVGISSSTPPPLRTAARSVQAGRQAVPAVPRSCCAGADADPRRTAAPVSRRPLSTLDEFVLGPSNCVAFTAAQRVLQRSGAAVAVVRLRTDGDGKDAFAGGHYAGGAAAARRETRRADVVRTVHLVLLGSLAGSGLPNFRRKYRDVDVLLIDDVQFFSGKRATHRGIETHGRHAASRSPPVGLCRGSAAGRDQRTGARIDRADLRRVGVRPRAAGRRDALAASAATWPSDGIRSVPDEVLQLIGASRSPATSASWAGP